MNPEEQEYYDIDEKNRVVLRIVDEHELSLVERGRQLGEAIEECITHGRAEATFLEIFVKELAVIQHVLGRFDNLKELDTEGYDIVGYMDSYLKCNDALDQIKHLGKHSLNLWSVGAAYEKFIYDKGLIEVYKSILEEFNKMG
ncbi:hypothetical protein BELINDA_16 [Bacillus phage Belinda]|uniref:hypothetical protein n=1 Tax=Bacillus phage Belinda TaxID=1852564 RepID=UPI0007F17E1E|nr:hypothetical protein BI039_gp016 [Bacillus phage Belinda]ANM45945.1 hypothetical protein BELINDA_16 [Bacillus phage Belinda]